MLIWSVYSIFGLWIAHRTLIDCEKLHLMSTKKIFQTRLFIFLTVIAINFLLRDLIILLNAFIIVIFLSPWYLPSIIERQREKLLKENFISILDHIILTMRTGRGFRPAYVMSVERNSKPVQYILNEFISALQYQKEIKSLSSDPKIIFFFKELAQVDQSSHKTIDRLKSLRRRLMIEKNFRQKSRQALLQVRFQSWIMTGMYVLILMYVQYDFGFKKHFSLIAASTFLFLVGLICIQKMGRNYQWKI